MNWIYLCKLKKTSILVSSNEAVMNKLLIFCMTKREIRSGQAKFCGTKREIRFGGQNPSGLRQKFTQAGFVQAEFGRK